jgi:hypothetical protein
MGNFRVGASDLSIFRSAVLCCSASLACPASSRLTYMHASGQAARGDRWGCKSSPRSSSWRRLHREPGVLGRLDSHRGGFSARPCARHRLARVEGRSARRDEARWVRCSSFTLSPSRSGVSIGRSQRARLVSRGARPDATKHDGRAIVLHLIHSFLLWRFERALAASKASA